MATLRAAVVAARERLGGAGIDEAQFEAESLLRYALECTAASAGAGRVGRANLYSRFEDVISPQALACYESVLTRRLAREPTAYITGRAGFRGMELRVTPDVLIPRPETEGLIDLVLRELGTPPRLGRRAARLRIADVGTGSGAIAIALARERPAAEVYATDLSRRALRVAAENAEGQGVARRVGWRAGYLLDPLHDYVDCIVANLPYVTTEDWRALEPELRDHEPRLALDGGDDGLDMIKRLLHQAPRYLRADGFVALEIGENQGETLSHFIASNLPGALRRIERDFAGKDRYCVIRPEAATSAAAGGNLEP